MGGFFPQVVSCNSMGVGCCSSEANDKKVVTPEQQVQKTHIFCAIHAKMIYHFTKTGFGINIGKALKKRSIYVFFVGQVLGDW